MCQWLLDHGAKITGHVYPLKDDATLMYLAACSGHLHICEWLAQSGARADVLVMQWDGELPLYGAIRRLNEHVARWLMPTGRFPDLPLPTPSQTLGMCVLGMWCLRVRVVSLETESIVGWGVVWASGRVRVPAPATLA